MPLGKPALTQHTVQSPRPIPPGGFYEWTFYVCAPHPIKLLGVLVSQAWEQAKRPATCEYSAPQRIRGIVRNTTNRPAVATVLLMVRS